MSGCFGGQEVTETGKGLPTVAVEFPPVAAAGSTQDAVFTISNPGPGDMTSLFVSFSRVGAAAADELPDPLVDVSVGEAPSSVVEVAPEPAAVSADGIIYTFPGLAEGESTTITFTLRIPDRDGLAANSVIVYDGQDVERGRGLRLETEVQS